MLFQNLSEKTMWCLVFKQAQTRTEYRADANSEEAQSYQSLDREVAKAVIRWFPTSAARVRAQVWSCGICGGQKWKWDSFSPSTSLSLPITIPQIAPQSPPFIIWGWCNMPVVAAVPSGLPHPTHSLTHGAERFLRSRQLCSHSRTSQHLMEPEGSLPLWSAA
jgi:hypothetical protein